MELNKNGRNFLLGTLFKSYLIQTAVCSLIIWVCTDVMDVAVSQIFRKCFGDYFFMYYRSLYTYMAGFAGWVICVIYLTYRLLKKVVSYVYELQEATGKLFDKSTDYIELSPELSEIAANINALKQEAEENARLAKESQQYKSDQIMYLAHDLKTPLSSVVGYLSLLQDDPQLSEDLRKKYLSIARNKAQRLEDLINEFFEITKYSLSEITLQYTKINLTRLLEQLIFEFQPMLQEKGLQCNFHGPEKIFLRCDADKIQRVFDNLLHNAIIYSFPNTAITITAELRTEEIRIRFENHGNTISKERLSQIFQQFYRIEPEKNTDSMGVNLAIAKQIAELHKGSISARSRDGISQFTVTLPVS